MIKPSSRALVFLWVLFMGFSSPSSGVEAAAEPQSQSQVSAIPSVFPRPQLSEFSGASTVVEQVIYEELDPKNPSFAGLPHKEGAYAIVIEDKKVGIYSYDAVGRFYAKQTLIALLMGVENSLCAQYDPFDKLDATEVARLGKLPIGRILDWPDMPYRGVVEGYYGTPWSHEARLNQFRFYGRNKINSYIWAPKDDPYHHGYECRTPYPEAEAAQITELAETARKNYVKFIWAIHPANTVDWSCEGGKPDLDSLCAKLELMYELGVRHFGVFVDDSEGAISKASNQSKLCSYISEHFVAKHKDVGPIIMCPTGYTRAWTPASWLQELGAELHPDIRVMWTGNGVAYKIELEGQQWVRKALGRPTFIWWNWPCTDYCRSQLAMGRTYELSQDPSMKELINGFVANPMEWPEASKIALFGVADYTWNIVNFESEKNWQAGIERLYPSCAPQMQTLANHNGDLTNNGHGFPREESIDFAPSAKSLRVNPAQLNVAAATEALREFVRIQESAATLLRDEKLVTMRAEIEPWIELFAQTGIMGESVIKSLQAMQSEGKIEEAQLARLLRASIRADKLRRGPKTPATGSRELVPLIVELSRELSSAVMATLSGEPKKQGTPIFSNSRNIKNSGESRIFDGDELSAWTSPKPQKVGDWVAFDYGSAQQIENIELIMGGPRQAEDFFDCAQMEYSQDGKNWQPLGEPTYGPRVRIELDEPLLAQHLRYRCISPRAGKWFNIVEFGINRPDNMRVSTDMAAWQGAGKLHLERSDEGINLRPIMEFSSMKPGESINIQLPHPSDISAITMDVGCADATNWLKIEMDGKIIDNSLFKADKLNADKRKNKPFRRSLRGEGIPQRVREISLSNKSDKEQNMKISELAFACPAIDPYALPVHLLDGDIMSSYLLSAPITLQAPKDCKSIIIVSSASPLINGRTPEGDGVIKTYSLVDGESESLSLSPQGEDNYIHEIIYITK